MPSVWMLKKILDYYYSTTTTATTTTTTNTTTTTTTTNIGPAELVYREFAYSHRDMLYGSRTQGVGNLFYLFSCFPPPGFRHWLQRMRDAMVASLEQGLQAS